MPHLSGSFQQPKKFVNSETGSEFTAAQVQDMITKVADEGRGLTKWEEGFIADISDQFERTSSLSDRQLIALERIYANKTE